MDNKTYFDSWIQVTVPYAPIGHNKTNEIKENYITKIIIELEKSGLVDSYLWLFEPTNFFIKFLPKNSFTKEELITAIKTELVKFELKEGDYTFEEISYETEKNNGDIKNFGGDNEARVFWEFLSSWCKFCILEIKVNTKDKDMNILKLEHCILNAYGIEEKEHHLQSLLSRYLSEIVFKEEKNRGRKLTEAEIIALQDKDFRKNILVNIAKTLGFNLS